VLLRLAWRNIGRGWRRSAIVMTAISVGLAACILIVSWSKGMLYQLVDTAVRTQLAHVAVHAAGYRANPDVQRSLPDGGRALAARAAERPGVHAAARLRGDGLVQSARQSLRAVITGVDPAAEAQVSSVPGSLVSGSFLDPPAAGGERSQLPPVVIGRLMAERLRVDVGDKVVLVVPGETGLGAFRVRGLFRTASSEFDRSAAFLRLADAQRLFAVGDRATEVALVLDEPRDAPALQAWLAAQPEAAGSEVLRWEEREPRLAAVLAFSGDTSWIFYGVIFVAMMFGIANALLMAVFERIREFGVLRSLGLRARQLVLLVVLESLLLTGAGTLLGLALGAGLVLALGRTGIDLAAFSAALEQFGIGSVVYPRLDWIDVLSPLALATATALLAALWPAWKAARLRPAEAVRHV
jgi:putative ABC transport system permease protein